MLSDALSLAGRGRLVLAGMQASSVVEVLRLLLESQANSDALHSSLSLSLKVVMAQRLLPRVDEPGMALASEVLPIGIEEARMLRAGDIKGLAAVIHGNAQDGVLSMDRCMSLLVKRGIITRDVARRNMNDTKMLEN